MSRYLPTITPAPSNRVFVPGPTPAEAKFQLDYASWYAGLAGHNAAGAPAPAGEPEIRRDRVWPAILDRAA